MDEAEVISRREWILIGTIILLDIFPVGDECSDGHHAAHGAGIEKRLKSMKKSKIYDFFIDFDTTYRFNHKKSAEHHSGYSAEKLKDA